MRILLILTGLIFSNLNANASDFDIGHFIGKTKEINHQIFECNKYEDDYMPDYSIHSLDDDPDSVSSNYALMQVTCDPGSYNKTDIWYLYDYEYDLLKVLSFAKKQGDNNFHSNVTLVNGDYNVMKKEISFIEKYAGHGACGLSGTYRWSKTSKAFELVMLKEQPNCMEGGEYKQIYP